jgi:deoxyhypusine synthase
MRRIERYMIEEWRAAESRGERLFPHEFFYRILKRADLAREFQVPATDSWLYAAMERNLPMFVPGWEDSTLGNMYAAQCITGETKSPHTVRNRATRTTTLPPTNLIWVTATTVLPEPSELFS